MLELINIAYADGVFCDKEKELLNHICKELEISQEDMNKMDQWVQKSLSVIIEGAELIKK